MIVSLSGAVTARLADWYVDRAVPIAFAACDPRIVVAAAALCGDDWTRCVTDDDGSITVYNQTQWRY